MFVYDAFPPVQNRDVIADAVFGNYPDIKVIDRVTPDVQDGGIADSQAKMEAILAANPEPGSIKAVWAAWDQPALGALQAIEDAGRADEGIVIVGIDGNPQARDAIARAAISSFHRPGLQRHRKGGRGGRRNAAGRRKHQAAGHLRSDQAKSRRRTPSSRHFRRMPGGGLVRRRRPRTAMSFLSLSNVAKSYGATTALDDASLALAAGEVHALMGENGAGKSTLIKILAGIESADRMRLLIDGEPATSTFGTGCARAGVPLHPSGTQRRPAALGGGKHLPRPGLSDARRSAASTGSGSTQIAAQALARLGIDHIDPRRKAARLSTGDQMLMRIAGTLVNAPGQVPARLYVMDEPTAALTGDESEKLFAVISRTC